MWSVSLSPTQPLNLFISESKMTRGKKGQQVCLCVRPRKSVIASEFDWTCVECQISLADTDYMTVALESLRGFKRSSRAQDCPPQKKKSYKCYVNNAGKTNFTLKSCAEATPLHSTANEVDKGTLGQVTLKYKQITLFEMEVTDTSL